jgi:hypothetical protein
MEAGALAKRVFLERRSARWERVRGRLPRALFVAVVSVTCVIGVREIFWPKQAPPAPPAPDVSVDQALEDYAIQFARAYLTYDPAQPEERDRALASLAPAGLEGGFQPAHAQTVRWATVAQNQEALAGGRIVVVAAKLSIQRSPVYLAVPIERGANGLMRITAYPSLVGPPAIGARAALPQREEVSDPRVVEVTRRVVANYLAGSARNLAADLAPEASVSIPTLRLRLRSVDSVTWADGPSSGAVVATVEATDGRGGTYTLSYELGVDERDGRVVVTYVETVPTAT